MFIFGTVNRLQFRQHATITSFSLSFKILTKLRVNFLYCVGKSPYTLLMKFPSSVSIILGNSRAPFVSKVCDNETRGAELRVETEVYRPFVDKLSTEPLVFYWCSITWCSCYFLLIKSFSYSSKSEKFKTEKWEIQNEKWEIQNEVSCKKLQKWVNRYL